MSEKGFFYIDDSIHDEAGFAMAAIVYTRVDPDAFIRDALLSNGFNADNVEFKSSTNYSQNPEMGPVRDKLKSFLFDRCKFGLVVIPRENRDRLGEISIDALRQFITYNNLSSISSTAYFDQGLFTSINSIKEPIIPNCVCHFEKDSKIVRGIQLADLVAHTCSIMLKESMGLITKKIKVGENSGYDPNSECDLGFELWASIRYSIFHDPDTSLRADPLLKHASFDVEPFGLFVSPLCSEELAEEVRCRFSMIYTGCIH